ncbi:MAG: FG-GAP-like repeat-containing protein [Terracidiphilus sp.]
MHFQRTLIAGRELLALLRPLWCSIAVVSLGQGVGLLHVWAAPASTITTLSVTSAGNALATVTTGSVVTLTATVTAGGNPVSPGQINFCDATAKYCTDIHLLGTAQSTGAGTATLKFRPGIGSHSYKAIFLGTTNAVASSSAVASVTVVAKSSPSVTTVTTSGVQGIYNLTATVSGNAGAAPTGPVSFVDMSNANAVLATATLTPVTTGATFLSSGIFIEVPVLVAAGDFNGDGITDLVAIQAFGDGFMLLGNGDATFEDAQTFTAPGANGIVGEFNSSIVTGDFNGDGKLDFATLYNGVVTIFLGNGDGTVTNGYQSQPIGAAHAFAVGDFNGDGKLDLVLAGGTTGSNVTILLGNGDGTFIVGATSPTGANPGAVAVGDFNGDGKLDIAVGNQNSNSVSILLGNGDGTFTSAESIAMTAGPNALAIADFNGDGKLDLAVAADGTVIILMGNGDGSFTGVGPASGYSGLTVAVGDFNADGVADLAVAGNNNLALLGNGDGTFTTVMSQQEVTDSGSIAIADFNGDGTSDIAGALAGDEDDTITLSLFQPESATATANNVLILPTSGNSYEHSIDASYTGDAEYGASVSDPISLLTEPLVSTALTNVPPFMAGMSATSMLMITPNQGFTGTVSLTCNIGGFSPLPTCSIPPSATLSGTAPVIVPVTISTTSQTQAGTDQLGIQALSNGTSLTGTEINFTIIAPSIMVPPSFTVTANPASIASPGATVTSTVTITPAAGFTGSVGVTCAVIVFPANAADLPGCSVSAPVTISGTAPVTTTLTISTTPAAASVVHDPLRRIVPVGGGMALAAVLFFGVPARRRKLKTLLALLLFAVVAGTDIGCGSMAKSPAPPPVNNPPANPGTTLGAYVVGVTATSGVITANTKFDVTVN